MGFSGKQSYSAGSTLPEIAEDCSDLVSIVSPFETPLLNALGDPPREAMSTLHEWVEDALLPNRDQINDATYTNALTDTNFDVDNGSYFRVGDLIKQDALGCSEVMLVTAVSTNQLTVTRGYGGSTAFALADNNWLNIVGHLTLEGADAETSRQTNRVRKTNWTQIFSATVEVSGTLNAVRTIGRNGSEFQFQKQNRMRELLRDLENSVINGIAPSANQQGSATVRRSMNGIIPTLSTNVFTPGSGGFPAGASITEAQLNYAMRKCWEQSASKVDLIVCNGVAKRSINGFIAQTARFYDPRDQRLAEMVGIYESDFGAAKVIVSRWCPLDSVLILDSSRINVLPLAGRSFQFTRLGRTGDAEQGQIVGEYTTEIRNQAAHAVIKGLSIT